jgi:exonuclease VII large subunit
MMNDSQLLKLSVGVAVIGLLGLFLYGSASSAGYSIAELDRATGQTVTINGTVSSMTISKAGNTFFMLSDGTGQVSVVVFKDDNIDVAGLDNGLRVEVTGQVQEYQGGTEIVAAAISLLSQNG